LEQDPELSWNKTLNKRDALVTRTNNALERYNRTLNEEFPTAHPKMPDA
jgi:hypothetical protein